MLSIANLIISLPLPLGFVDWTHATHVLDRHTVAIMCFSTVITVPACEYTL